MDKKLFRVYESGMVDLEHEDVCIGQIYAAPANCDVCGQSGLAVFELDLLSRDVALCAECLRVLADAVEAFRE